MAKRFLLFAPFMFVAFLAFIGLGGLIVRELWNWLLPPLFGLPIVTFWQALGLLLLSRILFGGFGGRGCSRWRSGDRWHAMSPDDRDAFRQRMPERWGGAASPREDARS